MITLIVGNKGSGKTKKMIDAANSAVKSSEGSVVCIEKGMKLTYDVDHKVRLISTEDYSICGYDALYGFIAGVISGNYDITDLFVDGTLKIGGRNMDELGEFLKEVDGLTSDVRITFTISADASDLPSSVQKYM